MTSNRTLQRVIIQLVHELPHVSLQGSVRHAYAVGNDNNLPHHVRRTRQTFKAMLESVLNRMIKRRNAVTLSDIELSKFFIGIVGGGSAYRLANFHIAVGMRVVFLELQIAKTASEVFSVRREIVWIV